MNGSNGLPVSRLRSPRQLAGLRSYHVSRVTRYVFALYQNIRIRKLIQEGRFLGVVESERGSRGLINAVRGGRMGYKITLIAISLLVVFSSRIGAALPDTTQEKKSVPAKKSEENLSSLPHPTGGRQADIWLNTVWKSIDEVTTTKESYEVEKITTVAGVRGVEAEDEATAHLYYRGRIEAPDRTQLQDAIKRLEILIASEQNRDRVPELKHYVIQCYLRLGDQRTARELTEELILEYPRSEWASLYEQ